MTLFLFEVEAPYHLRKNKLNKGYIKIIAVITKIKNKIKAFSKFNNFFTKVFVLILYNSFDMLPNINNWKPV